MSKQTFIHPTCDISPHASIGSGTKIWNWSHVREGASVGSDNVIGDLVYIDVDVKIGDRCRLMPKVSIGSGVEIGNDVFVGPNVVFANDPSPRAWTKRDLTGIRWVVEDCASIGTNVVVLPDVNIGHHALIAPQSTVNRDVPPHALVFGSPVRHVGWVCTQGHRMKPVREVADGAIYACEKTGEEVLILRAWIEGKWKHAQVS